MAWFRPERLLYRSLIIVKVVERNKQAAKEIKPTAMSEDEDQAQQEYRGAEGQPERAIGSKAFRKERKCFRAKLIERLFDGDRLRQIARLIDVAAAPHADVIGQQLQRQNRKNRRDQIA